MRVRGLTHSVTRYVTHGLTFACGIACGAKLFSKQATKKDNDVDKFPVASMIKAEYESERNNPDWRFFYKSFKRPCNKTIGMLKLVAKVNNKQIIPSADNIDNYDSQSDTSYIYDCTKDSDILTKFPKFNDNQRNNLTDLQICESTDKKSMQNRHNIMKTKQQYPELILPCDETVSILRKQISIDNDDNGDDGGHKINVCEINYAGSDENHGIIIFVHGGAWTGGDYESGFGMCSVLSQLTKMVVVGMDYRLLPENTVDDQNDDVMHVLRHYYKRVNYGSSNIPIFIIGDSAGANLTLLTCQRLLSDNCDLPLPTGAILVSPLTDGTLSSKSWFVNQGKDLTIPSRDELVDFVDLVCGNIKYKFTYDKDKNVNIIDKDSCFVQRDWNLRLQNLMNPKYFPFFGEFKGLCPLYFIAGKTEVLFDDSRKCVYKAIENNVTVDWDWNENFIHSGTLRVNQSPEARDALVRAAQWMQNIAGPKPL